MSSCSRRLVFQTARKERPKPASFSQLLKAPLGSESVQDRITKYNQIGGDVYLLMNYIRLNSDGKSLQDWQVSPSMKDWGCSKMLMWIDTTVLRLQYYLQVRDYQHFNKLTSMRHWERGNPHIYRGRFKQAATNISLWMLLVVFLGSISNRAALKPFLRKLTRDN